MTDVSNVETAAPLDSSLANGASSHNDLPISDATVVAPPSTSAVSEPQEPVEGGVATVAVDGAPVTAPTLSSADVQLLIKQTEEQSEVIESLLDEVESARKAYDDLYKAHQRLIAENTVSFGLEVDNVRFTSVNQAWNALDEPGKQTVSIAIAAMFRTDVLKPHIFVIMQNLSQLMMFPERFPEAFAMIEQQVNQLFAQQHQQKIG